MTPDSTPPPVPPGVSSAIQPPKKRRWLLWGCGGLLALLLIIVATVAITIWWLQRPIKPVVLSEKEKATVEQKLDRVRDSGESKTSLSAQKNPTPIEPDRIYVPGSRELRLTERELNGLLNLNTDLGKTVRIELARDAINAYLAVPIPKDFPFGGGKMFRARGRFRVSLGGDHAPYAVLEDVTVFGVSLPKDWLGGLKGENLLGDAVGEDHGKPILSGVKSLRIVPGAIVLEVNE